jgi:hypothetical protein
MFRHLLLSSPCTAVCTFPSLRNPTENSVVAAAFHKYSSETVRLVIICVFWLDPSLGFLVFLLSFFLVHLCICFGKDQARFRLFLAYDFAQTVHSSFSQTILFVGTPQKENSQKILSIITKPHPRPELIYSFSTETPIIPSIKSLPCYVAFGSSLKTL